MYCTCNNIKRHFSTLTSIYLLSHVRAHVDDGVISVNISSNDPLSFVNWPHCTCTEYFSKLFQRLIRGCIVLINTISGLGTMVGGGVYVCKYPRTNLKNVIAVSSVLIACYGFAITYMLCEFVSIPPSLTGTLCNVRDEKKISESSLCVENCGGTRGCIFYLLFGTFFYFFFYLSSLSVYLFFPLQYAGECSIEKCTERQECFD